MQLVRDVPSGGHRHLAFHSKKACSEPGGSCPNSVRHQPHHGLKKPRQIVTLTMQSVAAYGVAVMSPRFSLSQHCGRIQAGRAAAASAAATLRDAIAQRGSARIILAAAPSQTEVYRELAVAPDIDWSRVTAFHMDEYVGLAPNAPERFSSWLQEQFISAVPGVDFRPMSTHGSIETALATYADEINARPIDLVCLGIGVNGHIAFNDPPDADLEDSRVIRQVELTQASRMQQVDDECFSELAAVPTHAVTLTIPALLRGRQLVCTVPGERKAEAVRALIGQPIGSAWPCTVLRTHPRCEVHVNARAGQLLPQAEKC